MVMSRMSSPVLVAASTATARIDFRPSKAGVDQVAAYGALESVPNCSQAPVAQFALAFEDPTRSGT
jgi:hypothetical protein